MKEIVNGGTLDLVLLKGPGALKMQRAAAASARTRRPAVMCGISLCLVIVPVAGHRVRPSR